MMNITSIKKERCCGCTACVFSCNKDAIVMKEDSQGFLYPVVNEALCNHCGICINVCTKGSRIKDLLEFTGLQQRAITMTCSVQDIDMPVDWDTVNNVVAESRERSLVNLQRSIEL